MLSPWPRRLAPGGLLLATACQANGATPAAAGDAGADAAAVSALAFRIDPSLACPGGTGVCAAPSQAVTLGLVAAADGVVSLGLQGDYGDAALTADSVTVVGGQATVTLETPSSSATFSVVAREGGAAGAASASLSVTVSKTGFATVRTIPSYTGLRPRVAFDGTDLVPSTCADLVASPPPSSTPWTSAPDGVAIALPVPAGVRMAIDVRIGHYAFGCADVNPLSPGAVHDVPVTVLDVPMALAKTNLSATFSFTPDATATNGWHATAAAAASRVGGAFFPSGTAEETALLDAMRASIPSTADQQQFDQLRSKGGWDSLANTWLGGHAPGIHARATIWLNDAAADDLGPLLAHIGNATNQIPVMAPVTVSALTGLAAAAAGVSQPAPFTLAADADDTMHLSGVVDFTATPYVAHLADAHARADVPSATSVGGAVADRIDCTGLAGSLVGAGVSYGTCDATCTGALCATALQAAWSAASGPSGSGADVVHLTITASAPAQVGDVAEPQFVQGGWLGQVAGAGVPAGFAVAGNLVATEKSGTP